MKKYLVLNQLGTPSAPTPEQVGEYLTEFLMDGNVLTLPRPFRDILVKIGIVPRRRYSSAQKYQKIWMDAGSPLAIYTENLRIKMQQELGQEWVVLVGMRYGRPSIQSAFEQIPSSAEEIVFLPLYPHHARATVGSALEKMQQMAGGRIVRIVSPFYSQDWYLEALTAQIQQHLKPQDHLLLSYHGLPVSQNIHQGISYQQQCLDTSAALQKKLNLSDLQISTSFQSRVGLNKWLEPSTEETVLNLASNGVRHLKVACPSFVADCLETLEEIGLELRSEFLKSGGESFELIPCLNDDDSLVRGLRHEILNSSR